MVLLLNTTNTNTITRSTSKGWGGWGGWGGEEIGIIPWLDYFGPAD